MTDNFDPDAWPRRNGGNSGASQPAKNPSRSPYDDDDDTYNYDDPGASAPHEADPYADPYSTGAGYGDAGFFTPGQPADAPAVDDPYGYDPYNTPQDDPYAAAAKYDGPSSDDPYAAAGSGYDDASLSPYGAPDPYDAYGEVSPPPQGGQNGRAGDPYRQPSAGDYYEDNPAVEPVGANYDDAYYDEAPRRGASPNAQDIYDNYDYATDDYGDDNRRGDRNDYRDDYRDDDYYDDDFGDDDDFDSRYATDDGGSNIKKIALIAAGILALLIVGALAFNSLFGGGDSSKKEASNTTTQSTVQSEQPNSSSSTPAQSNPNNSSSSSTSSTTAAAKPDEAPPELVAVLKGGLGAWEQFSKDGVLTPLQKYFVKTGDQYIRFEAEAETRAKQAPADIIDMQIDLKGAVFTKKSDTVYSVAGTLVFSAPGRVAEQSPVEIEMVRSSPTGVWQISTIRKK